VGLITFVGVIGIVVPCYQGSCWSGLPVGVWASGTPTPTGWVVFGVATTVALPGFAL